jgi:CelD/BcsL family acetyltransferase involved in cellulose biosynthesis
MRHCVLYASPAVATFDMVKINFEVVSDPQTFEKLKSEWDYLWKRAADAGIAQSFDYCHDVWQTTARANGHTVFCVTGREDGRLILVWPLLKYRKRMRKFLRPFGATGAECTGALIENDIHRQTRTEALWSFVKSHCKADFIVLPFVRSISRLDEVLALTNGKVEHEVTFLAKGSSEASWESFYESLSKSHRKKHGNIRRRLSELGTVSFEIVPAGDSRCPKLIRWMLEQKRIWADRTGKRGDWLYFDEYRELLTRLLLDGDAEPKRVIMSLTLDKAPIAAKVAAIGNGVLELLVAGFDASLEKYSPGMRLDEYWVRWAIEQKLDIDFGVGREHYKSFWTRDNEIPVSSYVIPASLLGRAEMKIRAQISALKADVSQ